MRVKAEDCYHICRIPNKEWWILLSPDLEWGFEKEEVFIAFESPETCIPLLPLLELTYTASCNIVYEGLQRASCHRELSRKFPFSNILQLALNWKTEYWPSLAVNWLESGYPISVELLNCLEELQKRERFSQQLRHRAMRLIKSLAGS
jgi:hypothetical protein